jgi:uncharacterized phage protein gp47/JayE
VQPVLGSVFGDRKKARWRVPLIWADDTGVHRASKSDVRAYLEASYRGIFGLAPGVALEDADARELDASADRYDEMLSAAVAIYESRSPSFAAGAALARLVRLNGVTRKGVQFASVQLTLDGAVGTVVPAGSLIASSVLPSVVFATDEPVTIDGPTEVSATATVSGALAEAAIVAHALTVRRTVVAGWNSVDNASEATNGAPAETDAQLRTRRALSVALPSQGSADGLRAHLLQLAGVRDAVVRENPEDTTQSLADGGVLAPHAIQVVIEGGDDAQIAAAIDLRRASGCTLVGSTSIDVAGRAIRFTRALHVPIYVVVHSAAPLASDVQDEIRAAIVSRGSGTLKLNGTPMPPAAIGEDVAVSDIYQAITLLAVTTRPGLKIGEIDIGTAPSPTTDTAVAIDYDQIATWDAGNVGFASP